MRIELCGPLGIGKTTLANKLAELTGWTLVPEPVEQHPFLKSFYSQPARFAFEKNLFFLLDYLHQIKEKNDGNFIFDHSAVVHRAYAALNGADVLEKPVFFALDRLIESSGPPDVLINLVCPAETIMQRIRKRGRDFESGVGLGYVENLLAEMQRQVKYVDHYIRVVNIDAAAYNFEENPADVEKVLAVIRQSVLPQAAVDQPMKMTA